MPPTKRKRGPRGAPATYTRGRTSKKRLLVDWDVPIFRRENVDPQRTVVRRGRMDRAAALAYIAGKDKRPLLVMRECSRCAGKDWALLSRSLNNDRTMLLTNWFHCVRLPDSVRHPRHAFHSLFPKDDRSHLFFATADGKDIRALPGDQAQSAVWKTMTSLIRKSYKTNPDKSLKQLLDVLNNFDALDSAEAQLKQRLDKELESHGPKSTKFKRLKKQFAELQTKRKALLDRERKLRKLSFK